MAVPIRSIRYPFAIDAGLGTLAEETSYDLHIRQMILQVVFTAPGERINRPDFGCGLRQMVFAPNSEVSANIVQVMIYQALEKWLGALIELIEVRAKAFEERLEVSIVYVVKARQERRYLNLEVTL